MEFGTQTLDRQSSLVAFSFDHIGAKEKACKKKNAEGEFRRLRAARRAARPPPRHLLKKVDENFYKKQPLATSGCERLIFILR